MTMNEKTTNNGDLCGPDFHAGVWTRDWNEAQARRDQQRMTELREQAAASSEGTELLRNEEMLDASIAAWKLLSTPALEDDGWNQALLAEVERHSRVKRVDVRRRRLSWIISAVGATLCLGGLLMIIRLNPTVNQGIPMASQMPESNSDLRLSGVEVSEQQSASEMKPDRSEEDLDQLLAEATLSCFALARETGVSLSENGEVLRDVVAVPEERSLPVRSLLPESMREWMNSEESVPLDQFWPFSS